MSQIKQQFNCTTVKLYEEPRPTATNRLDYISAPETQLIPICKGGGGGGGGLQTKIKSLSDFQCLVNGFEVIHSDLMTAHYTKCISYD